MLNISYTVEHHDNRVYLFIKAKDGDDFVTSIAAAYIDFTTEYKNLKLIDLHIGLYDDDFVHNKSTVRMIFEHSEVPMSAAEFQKVLTRAIIDILS